jgi:hypothetical protein
MHHHWHDRAGKLPGRFAARETATDDVNFVRHSSNLGRKENPFKR